MNILVHGGVYRNDRQLGIQRYYDQLLPRLVGQRAAVSLWMDGPWVGDLPIACRPVGFDGKHVPRCSLLHRAWRRFERSYLVNVLKPYDVYYPTFFQPPTRQHADLPQVCTVYDMIVERFPELCGEWGREQAELKAAAIDRSRHIFAISNATAKDLVQFYPAMQNRVTVTQLGADHLSGSELDAPDNRWVSEIGSRFALYAGDRPGYKNFGQLLEAARSRIWPKELRLAVVGPELTREEREEAVRFGDRVHHLGRVRDNNLRALIKAADFVVVPSRCEGFGLPVVEAQILGTPVLCSDIPVFREVAGDAAEFFALDNANNLAEHAAVLFEDVDLRRRLRNRGLKNSTRFTWDCCADRTWQVFRKSFS